jgi:RNA polymerase sigma-70 factor (ECF subfamily)
MKDPHVDTGKVKSSTVGSTSSSLLERVRGKAPGSWERLMSLYCPLVYGWARRAGLSAEDAADVVQDVFLAVVKNLDGFHHNGAGDTFRGWLWTITQNKLRDLFRLKAGRPDAVGGTDAQQFLLQVPEASLSGSGELASGRAGPLFIRALEMIRSEFETVSWQAFWAVVVEGRRPGDVAAALGISANAIYIARSRILRRLRDELGDPPTGSWEGGGKR